MNYKQLIEQRKTRPLPLLHKQQLAPFTSPGKIIQKTRNPTTHSTASGVNSPFAGKGPNPVPKITAEYEGLVGTKLQVPANKDFASEPRIPDLPLPELNYFKVEEDKAEIECPMLNIRLCDGKNNELASVKFPKKIRSPKNTETFAVLQQYLEKMLNESAEKHSLQRSLVSSPREVANNKKGNETQIAFMDNQMIIQGKSSNAKTKNLSLTRLLLSQQCFPELDHKSPQHPAVATGFEKKLDVTNKQPSNLQDFINISGLDIKTRPKEMRKLVYNISRKSVKYDGHKAVEPRLKAQILSGIGEEAKDLVEMVMDPKGDVIIRPKEREKHVPKRMHLMNQRALHTKKLNRRQASQCVYRMPKIVQKVQEPAVIVSSLATPPITQVTKGKVIATPRQACRKQQHLVSVSPLRKVSHDSLEEKKNESAKVTPQKVKVKFTKKKVKDPEVVHSDQRAQALVNITALNEVHIIQYTSNKEPSKIKIIHTDYTHHSNHIINKTLNGLNQFISATFRNKDNYLDSKLISKLSKAFCLQLPVGKNAITAQGFKNKDLANPIKERLLKSLFYIINSDNEIPLSLCPLKTPQYRFYISTGNNGVMVRSILKQRWWWTYGKKSDENLNLLWTQWSKKSFIQALPSKKQRSTTDIWKEERKSDTSTLTGNISIESEGDTTASKQTPRASKIAKTMQISSSSTVKMCNHLENHYHLSNKKAMFFNMNQYYLAMKKDPFDTLPLTFHIRSGVEDVEFQKFSVYYQNLENVLKAHLAEKNEKHGEGGVAADKGKPVVEKNIWIIKPGENSNRGYGIQVLREFEEIKKAISGSCTHNGEKEAATGNRTFIIQKYIERPLLIYKRKFDIRMFGLITSVNGFLKGYYYEEGYLRTSSKEYTLKNLTKKTIHLTNDAVQNRAEDYGKYETGNKLSFFDFQKYLDLSYGSLHIDFYRDILPQIKVHFYFNLINILIQYRKSQQTRFEQYTPLQTHLRGPIRLRSLATIL
eukprot:TRINITY_DN1741_c0_g3_i1.p1 TRINITY_DN1741_c0_g3~~TRINITY_DN1741_c0_g3_i1.p1  ORF type:complete len:989 (-),score=89.28 TRINITY_DN1741_c0_g3_i1:6849-9815(-)